MRTLMLLALQLFVALCFGQKKFNGLWDGKLAVGGGIELRIVFNFSADSANKLKLVVELPEQGTNVTPSEVIFSGDTVNVEIKEALVKFRGILVNDSSIKGEWKQAGMSSPLNLQKTDKIFKAVRSQTPVPPFPYKSEDVEYFNADKSIKYAGTITIPPGKGPFPAAILITGSGQQNRDEETMGHKPFAVIADHLTRQGMVILRVDDRGIGGTTGDMKVTTADFAKDVMVGLNYLKKRPEVNAKKLGMIGHSEGGMMAPMIAAERKDIDFIVLLAAPGVKTIDLMTEQNQAILSKTPMNKNYIQVYSRLYRKIVETINNTVDPTAVRENITQVVDKWRDTTDKTAVMMTTGIFNTKKRDEFVNAFASLAENPWYKYYFKFDPAPYLEKLSCKVLALNGDKDIQVLSTSNLEGIRTALKRSKVKTSEVIEMPGLNHLFQTCKECTLVEYSKLDETFSPAALNKMSEWLKKNVIL